jgi:arylsulfatase A-like enzyme
VGRILDLVKQLGLDENTIFIFVSDNGRCRSRGLTPNTSTAQPVSADAKVRPTEDFRAVSCALAGMIASGDERPRDRFRGLAANAVEIIGLTDAHWD